MSASVSIYDKILEEAVGMAREAGKILLEYFRTDSLEIQTKLNSSDVVTAADKASEKFITDKIKKLFPTHGIISEESDSYRPDSEWRWVIDPLDGTTNFSQGLPMFSVSVAVERDGETVAGVVFAPYLNELFTAVKGGGAFFNGERIKCSEKTCIEEAVVATGIPYDKKENPDNNIEEVSRIAPQVRGIRRMGSAALDLCYVAAAFFDAYWELDLKHWDVAAGTLIVKEAGGKVFPIRQHRNFSIMASGPSLSDAMLRLLLTPDIHHSHGT